MNYLTYKERREREDALELFLYSLPTGHTISFPLPTKRWRWPAYVSFASPTTILPNAPRDQWPPTIWWALDARTGSLLIYTRWEIMPFADSSGWTKVIFAESEEESIDDYRARQERLEALLDQVIPYFFDDGSCYKQLREQAMTQLQQFIDEPILEQYRALTPDFLAWLEA